MSFPFEPKTIQAVQVVAPRPQRVLARRKARAARREARGL